MYEHSATQRNIKTLEEDGVMVSKTRVTTLACGDKGSGGVLKSRDAVKYFLDNIVL